MPSLYSGSGSGFLGVAVLLILVMVGAAAGSSGRWLLDRAIQSRHQTTFPWGTWTVNVLGSLVLGVLLGLSQEGRVSPEALALLGVGLCGGFTTFGTFSFETLRLAEEGDLSVAVLNVLASVGGAMLAASGGWYVATMWWS